ncbi:hypothetical protein F5887DRAFT_238179 [Amanita rubescens]|nr:hypothetical protein F5887DRAFT_1244776 [Amanita rubescens]KAF8345023.1 hypothetical protein F5887DRAFT_238179 [Amanita rubescens]
MSAQSRIPTEMLRHIFHFLRDADKPISLDVLNNRFEDPQHFPWAVGQVSRCWRYAFISHPPLWTSLSLYWESGLKRSTAYINEIDRRTAIYLERSGALPLSIFVSTNCTSIERGPAAIMRTLASRSNRWKKLELRIGARSENGFLLGCEGQLPILTSLKLQIVKDRVASNFSPIFEATPSLLELDLSERLWKMKFPWAQLTKLKLSVSWTDCYHDSNEWHAFLSQLKNVEILQLGVTGFRPSWTPPPPFPAVLLPRLSCLTMTLMYPEVFSWLTTPLLEHLRIDDSLVHSEEYKNGISSLVNRSSCRIRRLTLLHGRTHAAPLMLEALTNVEELFVDGPAYAFPNIIQYIAGFNNHVYLPKLRLFEMRYCPAHNIEELVAAVSRLLAGRGQGSNLTPESRNNALLEKLVIQLQWCSSCGIYLSRDPGGIQVMETIRNLPSDADIYIDDSAIKRFGIKPGNAE